MKTSGEESGGETASDRHSEPSGGFGTLTTKSADPQRANAGVGTFVIKDSRVDRGGGQWEHPPGDGIVIGPYLAHIFKDFP